MSTNELYTVLDVMGVNIYSCLLPSELHALTLTSKHLSSDVPQHLVRTCIEVFSQSVGYSIEDKSGNHFSVGFAKGGAFPSKGELVKSHLRHIHRDGLRICDTESEEESMEQATALLRQDKACFLPFTHPDGDENVMISPRYNFCGRRGLISSEEALSSMWIYKCKVMKSRDFVRRAWVYRHLGINKNQANTFTRLDLIRAWVYCLMRLKQARVICESSFDVNWQALNLDVPDKDAIQLSGYRERTDSYFIRSELGDVITVEQYQMRI
jgi:hypothetical protein